jgi:uncharacterized protein (TIGR03067 family)
MRTYLCGFLGLAVMAGLASAAFAPEIKDQTKEDQEKIQGNWKVESATVAGMKDPEEVLKIELSIKGDKIVSKRRAENQVQEGTIKLDAGGKVKTIDIQTEDMLLHGIYKLEGDSLTICLDESGEARPAEFESKEGSRVALVVLKRVKN